MMVNILSAFNARCSVALVAALTLVSVNISAAHAQTCSGANLNSVAGCADASIATCQLTYPACQSDDAAYTLEDVKQEASERCCDATKAKKRKSCLAGIVRRYNSSAAKARGVDVRQFLLSARNAVKAIQASDCGAGAYGQLF